MSVLSVRDNKNKKVIGITEDRPIKIQLQVVCLPPSEKRSGAERRPAWVSRSFGLQQHTPTRKINPYCLSVFAGACVDGIQETALAESTKQQIMQNENASFSGENRPLCYCWRCYTEADFFEEIGSVQEYHCPKCYIRIRVGDPEFIDPLRTPDDDSDSSIVCVPPTSRRSTATTITFSETGASDDTDTRPITPENVDLSVQPPSAPTNTPADGDVPDAPPNIAEAFADVTNFLLNVPTPKRRHHRASFGGLSSISGSDSIGPSKMIENIVQAYKGCSVAVGPETKMNVGHNIEIRSTSSPDMKELKP